ncbi:WD40 repeat-like protein [Hysterangium stoloniferum]|nr:WD40 repeat-like protein [Hysterangium stoloniferum]
MRTRHTTHTLSNFPIYSSAFLSNDLLVLGGGGGSGKSGIKNCIRLYRVGNDESIQLLDEVQLGDEDAPMSMAVNPDESELVCGINSTLSELREGKNENCRVFSVKDGKLKPTRRCSTFQSDDAEDYQNVTSFSPDHNLLAIGSTRDEVVLLAYKTLSPVAPPILSQSGQLYDVSLSPTSLVIATKENLNVYSIKTSEKGDCTLNHVKTVDVPESSSSLTFRAARFHPKEFNVLYTVMNASPRRKDPRSTPRYAYVCKWDTSTWKMIKMRKIAEKSVTCFDISEDGKMLAFGSSNYTIGLLDSQTLAPLLSILKAHEFPPTTLRFSPDSSVLVSGSADNTVRIIVVPSTFGGSWKIILIGLALLFLLLAIAIQRGILSL